MSKNEYLIFLWWYSLLIRKTMDHIEVTRRDEGKFTRILVSKKHIISAMPYRNGDIEGTCLEIDNINGDKLLIVEPYPYIRAILLGISNFRHKEDYDF